MSNERSNSLGNSSSINGYRNKSTQCGLLNIYSETVGDSKSGYNTKKTKSLWVELHKNLLFLVDPAKRYECLVHPNAVIDLKGSHIMLLEDLNVLLANPAAIASSKQFDAVLNSSFTFVVHQPTSNKRHFLRCISARECNLWYTGCKKSLEEPVQGSLIFHKGKPVFDAEDAAAISNINHELLEFMENQYSQLKQQITTINKDTSIAIDSVKQLKAEKKLLANELIQLRQQNAVVEEELNKFQASTQQLNATHAIEKQFNFTSLTTAMDYILQLNSSRVEILQNGKNKMKLMELAAKHQMQPVLNHDRSNVALLTLANQELNFINNEIAAFNNAQQYTTQPANAEKNENSDNLNAHDYHSPCHSLHDSLSNLLSGLVTDIVVKNTLALEFDELTKQKLDKKSKYFEEKEAILQQIHNSSFNTSPAKVRSPRKV
jgi:hypothetical protein